MKAIYNCGHESKLADHRRGATRQAIVDSVAARPCPRCSLERLAAKLTYKDGSPYSTENQAAYVAARLPKIY